MDNDLEEAARWYCDHEITCFDSDNSNDQVWGNKGKKFSEEWKKKQSEGIKKFYQENQERVQEIRDKIKATQSTEEYKKKYHDSRVKMWQNPEYRKHRKELSERRKNERK